MSRDAQARQDVRLANEAWEALFRAQALLARRFRGDDVWQEVSPTEYDVLYALARDERDRRDGAGGGDEDVGGGGGGGGLSMVEINREVLLTQGGISRLVARLVERGLLQRREDPRDRRAARIVLTPEGRAVQRAVGRRHARAVGVTMSSALSREQLQQLQQLCGHLGAAVQEEVR
ncbi:MarR family transcriptional regulator [Paenibacillus sp. TRM 82003]|uniref:MarR family winged helix-turn-helix transcriptional regulator n=1 Tax=Kineococcus sp. TRM81007 TaxID=2925831 RepID=UPI001F5827E4|nr:MarR family transcriptional regulator [Kineococcus sp. TRM81007]MCI2237933.1 MarR family transcriptional regulator [Kineococcus sp. TRM81007]MCI3925947.1 MarR family transcriptional regulator [Paenibacillus sp. TRM 82003]